jgi:hypothetical protein
MQQQRESIIAPILVWSALQIIALLLAANRVQLWARMPQSTENYALPIMLAMQIAFAAMLFPWLMRNARSTAFVFVVGLLFLELAGVLANETGRRIVWAIAQLWMVLLVLTLWRAALTTARAQMIAIAIASCFVIGGACVGYLQMEFTDAHRSAVAGYFSLGAMAIAAAIILVRRKSFPQAANR